MKSTITKIFFLLGTLNVYSQAPTSTDIIDYNNVAATISDGGIYFRDILNNSSGYEIPKGSGANAIYSAAFWYGGHDADSVLRISAQEFESNLDIFPGPFSSSQAYDNPDYISKYSPAIWHVNQYDINQHITNYNLPGYVVPASIAGWPGNGDTLLGISYQLAPFVDLDSDGKYEPNSGDHPEIQGCEAVFVIVNDDAKEHMASYGEKIGIEVHLMFYQYETGDFLNNTTFISKKIINRGTHSFTDFTTTFFMDGDFGNAFDDRVGCDSTLNLMYTYNGSNAPSVGVMTLHDSLLASGYFSGNNIYPYIDPVNSGQFWRYMTGHWANGADMVYGGSAIFGSAGATNIPTTFAFSGDPYDLNQWSEMSADIPPGDRRSYMSVRNGLFSPGDTIELDLAVLYDGVGGVAESVNSLKEIADSIQTFYNLQTTICIEPHAGIDEPAFTGFKLYPNPADGIFTIDLAHEMDAVTLEIHDMNGKKVFSKKYSDVKLLEVDLEGYIGVFYVTLQNKTGVTKYKLVKK